MTGFPDPDESLGEALSTTTDTPARVAVLALGVSTSQVALAGAVVGIARQAGRGVLVM